MRKIMFFIAALAAATTSLTSCSSDDETSAQSPSEAKNAKIEFAVNGKNATRATPTTAANYLTQIPSFKVWGYISSGTNSGTYYLGEEGANGVLINGDGQGSWSYADKTKVAYWAGETPISFYAVTPAENDNYAFASGNLTYTIPTDQSQQVDLMIAKAADQTVSTNAGVVALNFEHALSLISFAAKTRNDLTEVEIESITVHNVNSVYATSLYSQGAFANAAYENYAVGLSSAVTANGTSAVSATDANGVLMLAPQTLTGWADNTTTEAADQNHQSYLEITCKIKIAGSYLVGSETTYGKTYVAFPATWEAGKKYVYTLVFGGGKKADGTSQLTPITFNVSVSDWGRSTDSDVSL